MCRYTFRVATDTTLIDCSAGRAQTTFPAGAVLIEEGRRAKVLYVLESGTVEVLKEGHTINRVSQRGAVFGEVSVLLDQPPMATVRALTECRVRVIDDALAFLETNPLAALAVARILARRLGAVTGYLVDLKRQYEDRQDHLGMVDEVLESLLQIQGRRQP